MSDQPSPSRTPSSTPSSTHSSTHSSTQSRDVALYLIPTPIGNREDITLRALRILSEADVIACEDTRTTGRLLSMYNISPKKLVALHAHNELESAARIIDYVEQGSVVAYCSDAGMPSISDPGHTLVQEAIKRQVRVIALPGASASLTALVASGLPADRFVFEGFPPHKKGRRTFFDRIVQHSQTVIMYESPFRIQSMMDELLSRCAQRQVCIARELTKVFEEFIRGTVAEVHQNLSARSPLKGEIVVILQAQQQ